MACGLSLVKYILFLFNLLCAICGILLIIFGALLFSNIHSLDDFKDALETQQIPIALIVLGSVVLLISFFGCCGAIRESYCMSMTYSIFLFILMIAQLTLVVYMFIAKEDYLKHMEHVVDRAWDRRTQKADYMDGLQIGFKCCGNRDYRDYTYQGFVPATCCEDASRCSVETAYKNGCKQTFVRFWDKNSDIIKYAGLIIAAIEFVGFIFSCCLANNIRNYRRRSAY
ncbi:hypothetical protein ACFFRR_008306 [Megaselia abdita]